MWSSWFAQQPREHMTGMNGIQTWLAHAGELLTHLQANDFQRLLSLFKCIFWLCVACIVLQLRRTVCRVATWVDEIRAAVKVSGFPAQRATKCCLSSCSGGRRMTSRKKVLLKVIILGDSGWVTSRFSSVPRNQLVKVKIHHEVQTAASCFLFFFCTPWLFLMGRNFVSAAVWLRILRVMDVHQF